MGKPYIRPACLEDTVELAIFLSQADIDEVTLLGSTPQKAVLAGFRDGPAYTVEWEGRVIAMFGVSGAPGQAARPWMLSTADTRKVTSLVREARSVVQEMMLRHSYLANIVWSKNKAHIRWIRWLGFRFNGNTVTHGGETFQWFEMTHD